MSFYIEDKELRTYFSKISFIFNNVDTIREHLDIIFVFGSTDDTNSGRALFMKYIHTKDTPFNFITIEKLYKDLRQYAFKEKGASLKKIKLAHLEYIALKNSFSVLIFPESPGSFAELGYFSANEDTRKKIIVSNKLKYFSKQTYVNSVIDFIHEDKELKQILYTENENEKFYEQYIKDLLMSYSDYESQIYVKFKKEKYEHMYSLGVLYELIKLFPSLSFTELLFLVKHAFQELSINIDDVDDYLKAMISLLVISNLIKREIQEDGKKIFNVVDDKFSCFKFKNSESEHIKILLHIDEITKRKSIK